VALNSLDVRIVAFVVAMLAGIFLHDRIFPD